MKLQWRRHVHFERVLFVCGDQNAGKSRFLRNMFRDPRLGTKQRLPKKGPIKPVALSQARTLHVQVSSPHERKFSLARFLRDIDWEVSRASKTYWRFNYAAALQPQATQTTPNVVDICRAIYKRYHPERIRVVQLDPRQDNGQGNLLTRA